MSITFLWKKSSFVFPGSPYMGTSPSNISLHLNENLQTSWLVIAKKTMGAPSSPKQPKLCLKTIRISLGVPPHPETVPNEGLQGFPTKNGIILVVTVTRKGPHPKYTSSSWCLCHSFEKSVRQIGSSPPRDPGGTFQKNA